MPYTFYHFLLFLTSIPLQLLSQNFPSEKQADAFISALQKQKVDTICTLKHDGIGLSKIIKLEESCENTEDDTYIFWKQNGKTYLTQKNNCNEHSLIEIKDDSFWEIYFGNKATIETEKIKYPEYIVENGTGKYKSSMRRAHYGFDRIVVYNCSKPESLQDIPSYYLNKKVYRSDINYKNTKNSYTNKFREQLNSIIKKNSKRLIALK